MDQVAPGASGPSAFSLASFSELLLPCLDAVGAASVIEVGAFEGEFTRDLLAWASRAGATVTAIDPDPRPGLLDLSDRHPELELVVRPSHAALADLPPADAVFIDGDHNHFTVLGELRLIAASARGAEMPLIALHDVCWPHGRRDGYYAPERIPAERRQPLAHDVLLAPGCAGTALAGLRCECAAEREGGAENGVLTAVEDLMGEIEGLRLAVVPMFFGLGVLWPEDAPWASSIAEIVEPWNRNPILQRLETDRLEHIVDRFKLEQQEVLLRSLVNSRAFALAETVSRLRQGGRPVFSRGEVRRVLGEGSD